MKFICPVCESFSFSVAKRTRLSIYKYLGADETITSCMTCYNQDRYDLWKEWTTRGQKSELDDWYNH